MRSSSEARPSDRTITAIAEDDMYRLSHHLEQAKFEGRVPGGDYEGYVDAPCSANGDTTPHRDCRADRR